MELRFALHRLTIDGDITQHDREFYTQCGKQRGQDRPPNGLDRRGERQPVFNM